MQNQYLNGQLRVLARKQEIGHKKKSAASHSYLNMGTEL